MREGMERGNGEREWGEGMERTSRVRGDDEWAS